MAAAARSASGNALAGRPYSACPPGWARPPVSTSRYGRSPTRRVFPAAEDRANQHLEHLRSNIAVTEKGPLPADVYQEAKRRLHAL